MELFGPERVRVRGLSAAEVTEPGVIRHIEGEKFSLGEPSGEKSQRALQFSEALRSAGLKAPVRKKFVMKFGLNFGVIYHLIQFQP